MMWIYKDKEIHSHDDLEPKCTDFVYVLSYDNDKYYIGKKAVRAMRKRPPLKGYKRNRRLLINLPFIDYEGSHDQTEELTVVRKEILYQCTSRKTTTYIEMALLIEYHAIFRDDYINENIGGTFFRNSLDGLLPEDKEEFLP
ncbi:MAG: hypothetical protein V3S69_02920 [Dehalococcoidales bacterium]